MICSALYSDSKHLYTLYNSMYECHYVRCHPERRHKHTSKNIHNYFAKICLLGFKCQTSSKCIWTQILNCQWIVLQLIELHMWILCWDTCLNWRRTNFIHPLTLRSKWDKSASKGLFGVRTIMGALLKDHSKPKLATSKGPLE